MLLALRLSELDSGTYREIKKVTFEDFVKRWMADYVEDKNFIKACKEDGNPMHHWRGFREALTNALAAAECPTIQIHGLRHTYASLLIAQGESPEYIKRQLGHASIRITFDLYGHLMPEVHQEASKKLQDQVFGQHKKAPSFYEP